MFLFHYKNSVIKFYPSRNYLWLEYKFCKKLYYLWFINLNISRNGGKYTFNFDISNKVLIFYCNTDNKALLSRYLQRIIIPKYDVHFIIRGKAEANLFGRVVQISNNGRQTLAFFKGNGLSIIDDFRM